MSSYILHTNKDKRLEQLPNTLPKFIWHFIKPYKWHWMFVQIFTLVWAVESTVGPLIAKKLIDVLQNYNGPKEEIWSAISFLIILSGVIWIITDLMHLGRNLIQMNIQPKLEANIKMTMTNYTLSHSYRYFADNFAGSLSNKISDITNSTKQIIRIMMEKISNTLVGLLIISSTFFAIKPIFAYIILTWTFFHLLIVMLATKKWTKASKIHSEARSKLTGKIVDAITNHTNIKSFANKDFEMKYIHRFQHDSVKTHRIVWWYIQKIVMILQVVNFTVNFLILTYLEISLYKSGYLSISEFIYIIIAFPPVAGLVWNVSFYIPDFTDSIGTGRQALETLNKIHEIKDEPNAKPIKIKKGKIVFNNVSFKYKKTWIFKDKNLIIEPGQKVGLVGQSGAGKSTFVNLLLRYFDIQKGEILIDDQNISKCTQESLRAQLSVIPQDTSLFHRTLLENIKYGNLKAAKKDVVAAAKQAHAHKFIMNLEDKYQSLVGERGIKLSGGQRQRIAIARAMLKNAPILILDEATSALDSESEQYIQDSLKTLMKGKTVIAVAHRLSTLLNMDRILVFSNGKVVEDGTHKELLEKKKYYAKLWKMQAGGFLKE